MAALDLSEQWPLSGFATGAALLASCYVALVITSSRPADDAEPPIVAPLIPIPYVGHLLGMAISGGSYVKALGRKHDDKPIFTLVVPWSRIYVVTDPSLAAAVQRASKALSFTPLVPDLTRSVLGLDAATTHAVRQGLDPEPGAPRGFLADMHDAVQAELGPGRGLDGLTLSAAAELAAGLAGYDADLRAWPGQAEEVDLLGWVRHLVTAGTARFLYGPRDPVAARPELEEALWDFDGGLGRLLLLGAAVPSAVPRLAARRPWRARERLVTALTAYLEGGGDGEAGVSGVVRRRVAVAERHGWPVAAVARSELSFLFAAVVNTATTGFWTLLHLFARPALLRAVRDEVLAHAVVRRAGPDRDTNGDGGTGTGTGTALALSVDGVRTACPRLLSVFREVLRLGSDNLSSRLVKADTVLADRYLLRRGAVVQIAAGVMHADEAIWGADAARFDPDRFLGEPQGAGAKGAVHPAAFRAFGGGKTLCPGRHFATSEVLTFVALVVLLFDMEAAAGGEIEVPGKNDRVLPVHILEPLVPVKVVVKPRNKDFDRIVIVK